MSSKLWANQTVQTAAKYAGAVGVVTLGFVGLSFARSAYTSGTSKRVQEEIAEGMRPAAQRAAHAVGDDWLDLLHRLKMFAKFAHEDFEAVTEACAAFAREKAVAYERPKLSTADVMLLRKSLQALIEAVRLMRAVIELKSKTALEDFDEVATDLNAKVEDESSAVLLDQQMVL